MNIGLWVLQVLLAIAFFAHGWMFLAPSPEIAIQMNAVFPRWFQVFLGVAEIAGAIGLTLPGITRIYPWLVSWAAAGLAIVVALATVFHAARGEWSSAATTLVLSVMTAFVARKRHSTHQIRGRQVTAASFRSTQSAI